MDGRLVLLARRWMRPRFGLRSMFIAVAVLALCLGIYVRRAREQQAAVQVIRECGGTVYYDFQVKSLRLYPEAEPPFPAWLVAGLGLDFLSDVVQVQMQDGRDAAPNCSPQRVLEHLAALRNLRHLYLENMVVTDAWLRAAGRLKRLETLCTHRVDAKEVTDAGMSCLGDLENLKIIELEHTSITDESLRVLGRLQALESLWLAGAHITDDGLAHLSKLTNLKKLDLGGRARITDRGLSSLSNLTSIEYLDLAGGRFTAAGLSDLYQLQRLRFLNLSNNRALGDDAMRVIGQFRRLKELTLANTAVTSAGIEHLAGLTTLETLDLTGNIAVDANALVHLRKLVRLQELDLGGTRVKFTQTNAAVFDTLSAIMHLEVQETGSDCRAIQALLPHCAIHGSRSFNARFGLDGYEALTYAVSRQSPMRRAIESEMMADGLNPEASAVIVSPKLIPPQRTLRRMIAIAMSETSSPTLAGQRRAFVERARTLELRIGRAGSPDDQASSVLKLGQSNASTCKVYNAAVDFELADLLLEHLKYLNGVRRKCGLTDQESDEHRRASADLKKCLIAASRHLGLGDHPLPWKVIDAVTRVWNETGRVPLQAGNRIAGKE